MDRRLPVIFAVIAAALLVVIGVRVSAGADTDERDTTPVELVPGTTPSTADAPEVTTPTTSTATPPPAPAPAPTTQAPKPKPKATTGGPVKPRITGDDDDDDDDGPDDDDDDDGPDDDDD